MIPYHLDGRDKQTLIGGVDITERRTETDHVHVGVFLGEEAALQPGMDTQHLRILAEELPVLLDGDIDGFIDSGIRWRKQQESA